MYSRYTYIARVSCLAWDSLFDNPRGEMYKLTKFTYILIYISGTKDFF